MSRVKLASVTLSATFCLSSIANGQENAFQAPVETSSDIQFVPVSSARGVVSFIQEADAPPATPPASAAPGTPERIPADRLNAIPKRSKDTNDVTGIPEPKVAPPPIALDDIKIANLSLDDVGTGEYPDDVTTDRLPDSVPLPMGPERGLTYYHTKPWVPGGFYHQPLYFEDAMLERHGHQRFPYLQPFISGARFFGSIPLAPYQWTLQKPLEDRHTLGSYRPGSAAPILRQRLPYDQKAIRNQIGASAAAAVAIPY